MMTAEAMAEEIAWLSDVELDNLADILIKNHPTRANRLEQRIAVWRERATPKPQPKPEPKKNKLDVRMSNWWK